MLLKLTIATLRLQVKRFVIFLSFLYESFRKKFLLFELLITQ